MTRQAAVLTLGDIRLTREASWGLVGKEKGSGQPAMNRSKQTNYDCKNYRRFSARPCFRFRLRCKRCFSLSALSRA